MTGAGCVSALGSTWSEVKCNILELHNCVRYMKEWEVYQDMQTRVAAPVDDFELPAHYSVKKRRGMGRVAQMSVLATERALEHAGLYKNPIISSAQTGIAFGSATGSSDAAMEFFGLLDQHTSQKVNGTTYLRMMSHTAAVNISVIFGTQGRMYTTSSACTAASQGIGYAYETIRSGQQTVMISGGAEELCPTQAAVFDTVYSASIKNSQPESTPRPFDEERDGLVLGEGASVLILEDYQHAVNRGANILAEVVGFATNTDGNHLVRPNKTTMAEVMRSALNSAGLSSSDIGYISGHGTATKYGDIAESYATNEVMGSEVPFSTLKSYTGHSLGACGAMEAWAAIEMMRENWFCPTLNLTKVDEACAPLAHIRDTPIERSVNYVMSNNFAFGGVNTALIFKRM